MDALTRGPVVVLAVVVAGAAVGGCYNPSPPAGSYRCSTADQSCPSGQHCTCGLCVKSDDQAACAFGVDSSAVTTVNEHERFTVNITAYRDTAMSAAADKFNGTVSLSSSWGDVNPPTVELVNGQAQAMVTLNRETLPPQTAKITATFAGNKGVSGKIGVKAPSFVRDATPTVSPPSGPSTFGFADSIVAEPNVVVTSAGDYRLYFGGGAANGQFKGYHVGVATSTDGTHFTPNPLPVLKGGMGMPINAPSAFGVGDKWYLAYSQGTAMNDVLSNQDVQIAGPSMDGIAAFPALGPGVVRMDCAYCDGGVQSPSVIADPAGGGWIMFFSAIHRIDANNSTASIGRASSIDGIHFVAEPAPLLSSDLAGEALLIAPRVIVDGTVFKMFYSYARLQDIKDIQNLCNDMNRVQIGYATSSDGFYWVRSPSNPAVAVGGTGWDLDSRALANGSVIARDGKSTTSGFSIYYTTFRQFSFLGLPVCLPNGIGRATRP